MREFQFLNRTISYQCLGEGPAIFLIPGLGGQCSFWSSVARELSSEFQTISFDYPGSGGSEPLAEVFSIDLMVKLVTELAQELKIEQFDVIGQSLGGAISQRLALRDEAQINRIILSCSWGHSDHYLHRSFSHRLDVLEQMGIENYAKAQLLSVLDPQEISRNPNVADEWEQKTLNSSDSKSIRERINAILDFDNSGNLGRIQKPVLVIAAEDDRVVPAYLSRRMAEEIPNSSTETFAAGGHFNAMTRPAQFLKAITPFLSAKNL